MSKAPANNTAEPEGQHGSAPYGGDGNAFAASTAMSAARAHFRVTMREVAGGPYLIVRAAEQCSHIDWGWVDPDGGAPSP